MNTLMSANIMVENILVSLGHQGIYSHHVDLIIIKLMHAELLQMHYDQILTVLIIISIFFIDLMVRHCHTCRIAPNH